MTRPSCKKVGALALVLGCAAHLPLTYASDVERSTQTVHVDQVSLPTTPLPTVVAQGGRLFSSRFSSVDGVGANLSLDPAATVRFSRVPRADLPGFQMHPFRNTGPSAQSCAECHDQPVVAGAGGLADNGIRDTRRTGNPAQFVLRNPLHLFGSGAVQRLAEEATQDLKRIRAKALEQARATGIAVTQPLATANGVSYGSITAMPSGEVDLSSLVGVDRDLIVKPYFWKGELASFLRALVRGSAELELGMQPLELVGPGADLDFDGVRDELTVGDITAMSVYLAALPRPVTKLELHHRLGGRHVLSQHAIRAIRNGERRFAQIGCAGCHRPSMEIRTSMFQEPSADLDFRDAALAGGTDPRMVGLDPLRPVKFDLTANPAVGGGDRLHCRSGSPASDTALASQAWAGRRLCFPQFESNGRGGAIVRLYGDLKRHDMGPALADAVDEIGTGPSLWKTRELWGVASTGPWLHDGRATTLADAILMHGGEGQAARNAFAALGAHERGELVAFLENLVLYQAGD